MMKRFSYSLFFLIALSGFAYVALAGPEDITFPVAELGNCASEAECRTYCDVPEHMDACLDFAEKNALMSDEEIERARKFKDIGLSGPGGCTGAESCHAYCEAEEHMDECLAFAKEHDLLSDEELEEIERFRPLMEQGLTPGGCRSEEECKRYCFAEDHMAECVAFGKEHGLISEDEIQQFETFQKYGGPGGCASKDECEAYCNNPDNRETCFAYAKEHGFMQEEEYMHMRENMERMQSDVRMPPEIERCIKEQVGEDVIEKMQSGTFTPNPEVGEAMRTCFEQLGGDMMQRGEEGAWDDEGMPEGDTYDEPAQDVADMERQFRAMPPEVTACLERELGEDFFEAVRTGELRPEEVHARASSCMEGSFRPQEERFEQMRDMQGSYGMPQGYEHDRQYEQYQQEGRYDEGTYDRYEGPSMPSEAPSEFQGRLYRLLPDALPASPMFLLIRLLTS